MEEKGNNDVMDLFWRGLTERRTRVFFLLFIFPVRPKDVENYYQNQHYCRTVEDSSSTQKDTLMNYPFFRCGSFFLFRHGATLSLRSQKTD